MTSSSFPRLALAAAAPLLVLLLAPTAGTASCGDYVKVMNGAAHHAELPQLPAAPKPCNGPHCSRSPDAPPLAPVAPVVVAPDDLACWVAARSPGPDAAGRRAVESTSPLPAGPTSDIFHPPR